MSWLLNGESLFSNDSPGFQTYLKGYFQSIKTFQNNKKGNNYAFSAMSVKYYFGSCLKSQHISTGSLKAECLDIK